MTLSPAVFDRRIAALDEPRFTQALAKRGHVRCKPVWRRAVEEPDYRHRRLRLRRNWPRRRAADQRNEPTPPQVKHGAAPSRRSAAFSAYHRVGGRSLGLA